MMRSPQGNGGGIDSPATRQRSNQSSSSQFYSTVSVQKLRRFNLLILVFRFASFCFSLAAAIFMFTNARGGVKSPSWLDYDSFRYVGIANAIVSVYSLFEVVAALLEILGRNTIFPEFIQVWFDFLHDQVFAYMLLSANSAGTAFLRTLRGTEICPDSSNAFCIQSDISIALGFVGFLFLGLSALLSGFRVVCYILNGSRFHV